MSETYKGSNWDYSNLMNKELWGWYSNNRIRPEETVWNQTLRPSTTQKFRFDIPISSKAVKMSSINLYIEGNIIIQNNLTITIDTLLFLWQLGPIQTAELKTKSGQLIYRNDKVRWYLWTFADRVKHTQKKNVQLSRLFYRKKYISANEKEYHCYGTHKDILPRLWEKQNEEFKAPEITSSLSGNYGDPLNLSSGTNNAGTAIEAYTFEAQTAVNYNNVLKWTINLGDILDSIFKMDLDILIPNDNLILTLDLDSNFICTRRVAFNSGETTCDFLLKNLELVYLTQEDADINKSLIASIEADSLLIPYEFIQTHTHTFNIADAASNFSFNKTMYNGSGDILRKIYLTTEHEGRNDYKLFDLLYKYQEFLYRVEFYFNSTLISTVYAESFDNSKLLINHFTNGYYNHDHKNNYFVPYYFCDPESHDIILSGLKLMPSSTYSFKIYKEATQLLTGQQNYNVHLVSVKYLKIESAGIVVLNSLEDVALNKKNVIETLK